MKNKTKTYVCSIFLTLAVGALSALATMGNMDIYKSINTPSFAPPGFLFPVVWTILYILMGISVAAVIVSGREKSLYIVPAIRTYLLQLAVNFFWSIIFFNMQSFLFSFIWLILLLILIIDMIAKFYPVNKFAAYINLPYLLWVIFAGILNFFIFRLN